jgi:hypothetical protein
MFFLFDSRGARRAQAVYREWSQQVKVGELEARSKTE